ncbi:MAG: hypothetical protein J5966_07450 [Lachnospiraceae bacterium]|nr:hypothetical protein [Lachnospiraceae bacterium]
MDKYEKKVRVNQIISCIKNGEYQDAQEIADTIDWRQEKSIRTLRMVSEVYKINRRYEDSLTVLNLAYEKNPEDPIKRKIVFDLCELAIKMGQFGLAVRYMKEFSKLAPRDPGRYILQYRLLKATDADYGERIELLEEFKSRHFGDFDGKWAYELAYMYHLTGKGDKCIECCNEIVLWFVTGPVVAKALKLKREHVPLTYEEEQKILSEDDGTAQEVLYQKRHQTDTAPVYMDTTPVIGDGYSTTGGEEQTVQPVYQPEPITEPMPRESSYPYNLQPESQEFNIEVKKVDPSTEPTIRIAEKKTGPSIMSKETMIFPNINKALTPYVQTIQDPAVMQYVPEQAEEMQPVPAQQVQTAAIPGVRDALIQTGTIAQQEISINLDKYSTMNLQAELRENMEKLQEETGEPLREKEEKLPERVAEPDRDLTELRAGEENTAFEKQEDLAEEAEVMQASEITEEPDIDMGPGTVQTGPENPAGLSDIEVAAKITNVPMPEQFKNIISQDYDGQLQLNVPAAEPPDEKQITGQMDIESILAEWDKLQEEARARRIHAAKKKSLDQTNELAKQLKDVLPGYVLPKLEEEKKEEPEPEEVKKPEPDMAEETEAAAEHPVAPIFTAPLVVPDYETGQVDISGIEEALEAEAELTEEDREEEEEPERPEKPERPERPVSRERRRKEPEEDDISADEEEKPAERAKKNPHFVSLDTVELPSVFDSFRHIKGLPQQLKEAEDRMSMDSSHGNVLIVGSEHAARMELIQAIVRDVTEREARSNIKAASIDSDTFNNKDVVKSLKALSGNILVIEGAGRLSDDSVNTMLSVLSDGDIKILVILEDSRVGAKNLNEYSGFEDVFDVSVDIPTLSNDYLVDHAKNYAMDKGYTLDDMAILALYQRIDERQTSDHVVTTDETEHIMDEAIKKANKKNLKHLGDVLLGKRYNDDDLIVLREKDFAK